MSTPSTAWPARTESRLRNRDALLTAAAELLELRGYAGMSLDAVATKAGLSKGAVYSSFGSKAELVLELLKPRWQAPRLEDVELAGQGTLEDLFEGYGRLWGRLVGSPGARDGLELALELQLSALRDPHLAARFHELVEQDRQELHDQLHDAAGLRGQHLTPHEIAHTVLTVSSALQGLAQYHVLMRQPVDEATFGALARRLAPAQEV